MIVGGGVGFDVLCLLYLNRVMCSANRCESLELIVILTVYVSYLLCGGYWDCLVSR